jgi:hypothetical protein
MDAVVKRKANMWEQITHRTLSRRLRTVAVAGVLALALSQGQRASLLAQDNFSGLQGKALQRVSDAAAFIEEAANRLAGAGTNLNGQIETVKVTDDGERRLSISIRYSGFGGAKIWADVRGADKNVQAVIPATSPLTLAAGPSQVELTLDLANGLPEDTAFTSGFLRLSVSRPDKTIAGVIRTFQLPKRWQQKVEPSHVVITVTASPVGAAANLGPAPAPVWVRPHVILRPAPAVVFQPASQPVVVAAPPPATTVVAQPMVIEERRTTVLKAETAFKHLPDRRMIAIDEFKPGVTKPDADQGAKGPANAPIDLLEGLAVEDVGLDQTQIVSVMPRLYPDQNPQLGIFYFLPQAYHLTWDPSRPGYGMRMLYTAAAAPDQPGQVVTATQLDAGVDLAEVQLAKDLMTAYVKRHPSTPFTALRPLPIDSIDVSVADTLRNYSIPPEKIAVVAISDVLGQVGLSWTTDTVTKENLQLALVEDVGISGTVTFTPSGGGLPKQQIPVDIKLADADTFGRVRWQRGQRWRNETLYTLKLRYLHALLIDQHSNSPVVYSWDLHQTDLPPQAQVDWNAAGVPAWIDGAAKRMWVDYVPLGACASCDRTAIEDITAGVWTLGSATATLHALAPFAATHAAEISVKVRSKYFYPSNRKMQKKVLIVNADGKDFPAGPIYFINRQDGEAVAGDPLLEYFIEVAMPDGTIHRATEWIPSDSARVLIGKVQIQNALGFLPGVPQ